MDTHAFCISCYKEHTRDGHSDTVCSQLKIFIPANWDYKCSPKHLDQRAFKSQNLILVSCSGAEGGSTVQASGLTEVEIN